MKKGVIREERTQCESFQKETTPLVLIIAILINKCIVKGVWEEGNMK